jgi:hypothetical protein
MQAADKCATRSGPEREVAEMEAMRNLADVLLDVYESTKAGRLNGAASVKVESLQEAFRHIPEAEYYDIEERAAIREHDGGMTKDEAERTTIAEYIKMRMN